MTNLAAVRAGEAVPRKPPAFAQWNWLTGGMDVEPAQLPLELPPLDDLVLPDNDTVTLLATENGAQLLVSGFGLFVGKKSERLVVRQGKEVCAQVPLMRLQEVIVASRGVSVSSDLIEELCSRGIRIGFLKSNGQPVALVTSPLLTATVEIRRAQLAAYSNGLGAQLCRWVVAGKIRNQEKLLRYFGKSREGTRRENLERAAGTLRRLRRQALGVEGESPEAVRAPLLGLEGTAGRMYWDQIGDVLPEEAGFEGRKHRGAPDAVNAALNYGYGILYMHVWGAVMNAGLEPFAGLLHTDRSGKPSLVLDLAEEFRQPVVDRAVLTWLSKGGGLSLAGGMLDGPSKEAVAERVMRRMQAEERYRGKSHQVRSIIQMQARSAASALRGMSRYRPFAFRW
jgi:CRISPR-associated protein Cas1